VLVDTAAGSWLVRATIGQQDAWPNALAVDHDLAAASELGKSHVAVEQLARLSGKIDDLSVAPDARHVAWSASFDVVQGSASYSEIMLLALGAEPAPIRLTDNDRHDARPRFVGGHLIFDSNYTGDDELPAIEAVRALSLP
jgi:hypothetical protein